MSELFWLLVAAVSSAVVGYGINEICRAVAQLKPSERLFSERVKVTVIMHMTRELSDKLDRLGGASWVMDKITYTQVEEPPEESRHTPPPQR